MPKKYSDDELIEAVQNSYSYAECREYLGLCKSGSGNSSIKANILKLGLSTNHFSTKKVERTKYNLDIYLNNEKTIKSDNLKKRLVKEGLLKYQCNICNIVDWQNKSISFHMDHIDGNRNNNNLSNLRILCPNCHSQTETYGTKRFKKDARDKCKCGLSKLISSNLCKQCSSKLPKPDRRKVVRPDKITLEGLVNTVPILQIAKKYGVTDNSIRKWCKYYGIIIKRRVVL